MNLEVQPLRKHTLVLRARRFRISPWPTRLSKHEKVCTCTEAAAMADRLRDLGAHTAFAICNHEDES